MVHRAAARAWNSRDVQLAFRMLDLAARLLLALGIGCLLLGAYLAWLTMSFRSDVLRTSGEVVSYHEIRDGETTRYRPRVRFRTVTGEIITIDGQLATSTQRFALGAPVPMIYRIGKPTEARVALIMDNWLGASIAGLVGLTGLVGGFLVRRAVRAELAKAGRNPQ